MGMCPPRHAARGCPCPSPNARRRLRKPNRVSDGDMPATPRRSGLPVPVAERTPSPQEAQSRKRWGCARHATPLGAARARRRTLATPLQGFARSMLSPLRHPGCAEKATPALGHGQLLADFMPCMPCMPCMQPRATCSRSQSLRPAPRPPLDGPPSSQRLEVFQHRGLLILGEDIREVVTGGALAGLPRVEERAAVGRS
jgi:hypothetical protein